MKLPEIWLRLKALPSFFWFVFFEKDKESYTKKIKYIWYKRLGLGCDVYPIYFPKQIFFRSLFGKFLTYISYKNIYKSNFRTIYVSLDFMDYFASKFLPDIKNKFILVTGDSDYSTSRFSYLLKNKNLVHWFAQNNDLSEDKITSIPIGVDYHTLFTADFFGEFKKDPLTQEQELIFVKNKGIKKELAVFANFHLNPTSKRRVEIYNSLKSSKLIFFQPKKLSRKKVWNLQSKFIFNLSPRGAGIDCLRTWESLILGQIPIVERTNTALDRLYSQFPIVIIKDLNEITLKNLKRWYKKYYPLINNETNYKLTNEYWLNKINEIKF